MGNIDPFLRSFSPEQKDSLHITSNAKWISVHPIVLSMVASLGLSIQDKSKIIFEHLEAKSKHYLERMGLFKSIGVDSGMSIISHEPSGRFIPLTRITSSDELSRFIAEMVPLLHATPEQAEPIKYVLSELVSNVFEHSMSSSGAVVCAQFYEKTRRISIGVADSGVGIRKTITASHSAQLDIDAINLALTPGITGATEKIGGTELNAGAGLFFIKSIAKVNRDFLVIYSGKGMYKLLKTDLRKEKVKLNSDPSLDKSSSKNDFPYWQGTAVGIDISIERNQDFDHLLDLIYEAYQKEIQERKKAKFRKAQFI
ncbi:Uncharacterised protein [uncultured archaeon]|nr:Uncharacterised protein [uncultured archaeon]